GHGVRAAVTIEIIVVILVPSTIVLRVAGRGVENVVSAESIDRNPVAVLWDVVFEDDITVLRSLERFVFYFNWGRHRHSPIVMPKDVAFARSVASLIRIFRETPAQTS